MKWDHHDFDLFDFIGTLKCNVCVMCMCVLRIKEKYIYQHLSKSSYRKMHNSNANVQSKDNVEI